MNIGAHVSFGIVVFPVYMSRSEIAGSYGSSGLKPGSLVGKESTFNAGDPGSTWKDTLEKG